MKYFGMLLLVGAFLSIMVEGTYSQSEIVEISLHLAPTPLAQPDLVERSLVEFNGIISAVLERSTSILSISYDKSQITLSDLEYLLSSMGYRSAPVIEPVQASL